MKSFSPVNAASFPTLGELERQLGHALQASYRQWTGHSPSSVVCHVTGQVVNLLIQDSITPLERFLKEPNGNPIRNSLHDEIRTVIPDMVLNCCGVAMDSVMVDSCMEGGYTGIVIVLAERPKVRSRKRKIQDTKPSQHLVTKSTDFL